jgi:hypothetical protein
VDKYLGELSFPMTAKYGNAFYAMFPLSNVVYKYDVNTKETQSINLQLPVALTNPASLPEPTDLTMFYEVMYRSNHIEGFAVVNDLIFVQQIDVFDENLESKKLTDHSVLYAYNNQGQLVWSGAFPEDIFGGTQTMFKLTFANDGKLHFIASNRNHENKLIQLSPKL